jgi:hypothetical protein
MAIGKDTVGRVVCMFGLGLGWGITEIQLNSDRPIVAVSMVVINTP